MASPWLLNPLKHSLLRLFSHPISLSISTTEASLTNRHFNPIVLPKHTQFSTLSLSNPNFNFPNWNHPLNKPPFQYNLNNTPISINRFARILSGHNNNSFEWKFALDGVNDGELGFISKDKQPVVTVVLLGWLGSKQKHLRRYAELYNMLGMNAVTFAASVYDVLGFDLGRKLESRIGVLTDELVKWVEEKDGRERFLMFHTFSNTGWLAYGSILNRLQGRQELLEKIKGCVVDSGGDPELDPKVWAAGFTAAMLRKQSSAVNSEAGEVETEGEKEPLFIEVFLLTLFEKFFACLLGFPDVNKRLMKVISTLSKNQPPHPQLYLYSTADKVIPFQKIESFADHQRKLGRQVTTFNFQSTPHVDHYRTFSDTYQSLIQSFLKDCFAAKEYN